MSALQIKLNDGTAFDIKGFNDSYIEKAINGMERSDEMQYRIIAQLSDYSLEINDIKNSFTNENLKKISIIYNDGDTETEQVSYDNLTIERINKYFSIDNGKLVKGYDVVFGR